MYRLPYSVALLLVSFILAHSRHTVFISQNGEHAYLPSSADPGVCMKPKCVIAASDVLTSLDETVDPCDDFYRFACGGWVKRRDVSKDEPEVHIISDMQNKLNLTLKELLESKYESSDPPFVKMLKDYYNTCVDLDSIKKKGSEPLKTVLSRLGGWPVIEGNKWDESTFDWVDSLISFRKLGYNHNILMQLSLDFKSFSESVYILHLTNPEDFIPFGSNLSLGLNDPKIAAYLKTMVKAAKLLGADETTAEKELLEVVHFMIALENSTILEEELIPEEEDEELFVEKEIRYHTVKELQDEVPKIPWLKYLNGMFNDAVYENDTVYVGGSIGFLIKLADLLSSTDKRVIANYMMMRAVLESAQFLPEEWKEMYEEQKALRYPWLKKSYGNEERAEPRWKICLSSLMMKMDIALSSYYVRHYFKDESKNEAMILTKYIRKKFLKILEENDWMDEKTKAKAEEKANALKSYIGYPKELLNDTFMMKMYENLTITPDSYLENEMAFKKLRTDKWLSTLRNPVDFKQSAKFEYILTVNAFYNPNENSIGVPAGILHDFYEKDRPNYMNFGAIGYVIGHEITHGFDNRGRYFDKDGNHVNWWDKDSDEHFTKKVQCIIDQYDNYTTDIGLKVNGEKTQNENIADNGGLKEAYLAYQSWTKDNGIEPLLPALNYTQNQLFWLSAAHVWCSKIHPEKLQEKLLGGDSHSPSQFRIIGPMSNLEEFSKDFKCSADSPMNRKYKCKVW